MIIPARREEFATLGPTIEAFLACPLYERIIVVDDGLSAAVRMMLRESYGALIYIAEGPREGKGQAVMAGLNLVEAERVTFCDGDLHGFNVSHAWILAAAVIPEIMIIGVTEYAEGVYVPWPVPPRAWLQVSGERSVPTGLVTGLELHGYAMETIINREADRKGLRTLPVELSGVHGTARWTDERKEEMKRDGAWLRENWNG